MDFLSALGIGLAIGMLAGTTGLHGSARGRMTLLAAVIGLVAGLLLFGLIEAIGGFLGAAGGCMAVSDIVAGAGRREGSSAGALGFLIAIVAIPVAALAYFFAPIVIVIVAALAWLAFTRHRRAQRKHAGLRILR
ncbi:MAG TPA: hypothetical protein VK889_02990 [Solirubrobacterales bacterium]|nr:hypothetical protein [Solirubrobacterales bacterium]